MAAVVVGVGKIGAEYRADLILIATRSDHCGLRRRGVASAPRGTRGSCTCRVLVIVRVLVRFSFCVIKGRARTRDQTRFSEITPILDKGSWVIITQIKRCSWRDSRPAWLDCWLSRMPDSRNCDLKYSCRVGLRNAGTIVN